MEINAKPTECEALHESLMALGNQLNEAYVILSQLEHSLFGLNSTESSEAKPSGTPPEGYLSLIRMELEHRHNQANELINLANRLRTIA